MKNAIFRTLTFLRYFFSAQTEYYLHSPFAYRFFEEVLNNAKQIDTSRIETLRLKLLQDKTVLNGTDYGAGNKTVPTVAAICRNAAIPKKYGALLQQAVAFFQPGIIVELGTSLGLSTAYLATGAKNAAVFTFEGNIAVAGIAEQNFQQLNIAGITVVRGPFDQTFSAFLAAHKKIDFAFIDGDHRYEPTLRYFEWLSVAAHEKTVLVFDDIYWSEEMMQAWNEIKAHPRTRIAIDLWRMGFVFFNSGKLEKESFILRY